MRVIPVFLAFAISFAASGCKKEMIHDVEYFKQNDDARKTTVETCRNNPGKLRGNPNCLNAFQAEKIIDAQRPWK